MAWYSIKRGSPAHSWRNLYRRKVNLQKVDDEGAFERVRVQVSFG